MIMLSNAKKTRSNRKLSLSKRLLYTKTPLSPKQTDKEREASLQRFQDFKERMKSQLTRGTGVNHVAHRGTAKGSCLGPKSDDSDDDDSSDLEQDQFDEGGIPLYDLQSQKKLEFKKYLRLQREGLVNLKDIFTKM